MLINLKDKVYSIGLMSGTSLDGVDVCLASHENNKHELIDFISYPYSDELKRLLMINTKDCLDKSNERYQKIVKKFRASMDNKKLL